MRIADQMLLKSLDERVKTLEGQPTEGGEAVLEMLSSIVGLLKNMDAEITALKGEKPDA